MVGIRLTLVFLLAAAVASFGGCVAQGGATGAYFDESGLVHSEESYALRYADAERFVLINEDWVVENFRSDGKGRPYERKRGPDYTGTLYFDVNEDGVRQEVGAVPIYDLRLRHRRTAAMMWIRTYPIPRDMGQTELDVLMRHYIDGIAGVGVSVVQLGAAGVSLEERRFAARTISSVSTRVSGHRAQDAVVDVFNVDQMQLDKATPVQRARVVLLRPFTQWLRATFTGRKREFPVLMVLSYYAQPDQYDHAVADFDRLLSSLELAAPR